MGESGTEPELGFGSPIDPLVLALAAPPVGGAVPPSATLHGSAEAAGSTNGWESAMVDALVRRVSWGGDRRRGIARIELGGVLEGGLITVEGEGREVSVELTLPPGAELDGLQRRLAERLGRRGLTLRSFDVR